MTEGSQSRPRSWRARIHTLSFAITVAVGALLVGLRLLPPAPHHTNALLIIDVQRCFIADGSLAVPHGEDIVPCINRLRSTFAWDHVVLTKDLHPPGHISFAPTHDQPPGTVIQLAYTADQQLCSHVSKCGEVAAESDPACVAPAHNLAQRLWPEHCVAGTEGSDLAPGLVVEASDHIINKGEDCHVDSYSAFTDNGGLRHTPLHPLLQRLGVQRLVVVGLAYDVCVRASALDAVKLGYEVTVLEDCCRGITADTYASATQQLRAANITVLATSD